jgi:hypothetical protein
MGEIKADGRFFEPSKGQSEDGGREPILMVAVARDGYALT